MASDSELARLDSFQRHFLQELPMTEEDAFLDFNFLTPTLRRRISVLGFAHKIALGLGHPLLGTLFPTKDQGGTKVFEEELFRCTYFRESLFHRNLAGILWYYNIFSSALRSATSVYAFQSVLTQQVRTKVEDRHPWRDSFNPREQ